jgi:hypothetical protein
VRQLQADPRGEVTPGGPLTAVSWLATPDRAEVMAPYAALFVSSTCQTCAGRVPAILAGIGSGSVPLLLVTDEPVPAWEPLPVGAAWVVDAQAPERFAVPAYPWLIAVGADGLVTDSFAVGGDDDVDRVIDLVARPVVARATAWSEGGGS